MMNSNSDPTPVPICADSNRNVLNIATNQAETDTLMNSMILTRLTGTPTARAEGALPPTEKIQLPYRVRNRR